jgi:hypothetical protein
MPAPQTFQSLSTGGQAETINCKISLPYDLAMGNQPGDMRSRCPLVNHDAGIAVLAYGTRITLLYPAHDSGVCCYTPGRAPWTGVVYQMTGTGAV